MHNHPGEPTTLMPVDLPQNPQVLKCLNREGAEIRGTNSILQFVIAHWEMGGESCHVGVERTLHFLNGNAWGRSSRRRNLSSKQNDVGLKVADFQKVINPKCCY
jgi:hypothetical protein